CLAFAAQYIEQCAAARAIGRPAHARGRLRYAVHLLRELSPVVFLKSYLFQTAKRLRKCPSRATQRSGISKNNGGSSVSRSDVFCIVLVVVILTPLVIVQAGPGFAPAWFDRDLAGVPVTVCATA